MIEREDSQPLGSKARHDESAPPPMPPSACVDWAPLPWPTECHRRRAHHPPPQSPFDQNLKSLTPYVNNLLIFVTISEPLIDNNCTYFSPILANAERIAWHLLSMQIEDLNTYNAVQPNPKLVTVDAYVDQMYLRFGYKFRRISQVRCLISDARKSGAGDRRKNCA